MEYRLKYRDVPWGVALAVLPGKIIGKFIINPFEYTTRNWKQMLVSGLEGILLAAVGLVIIVAVLSFVEIFTDGAISRIFEDTIKELIS